MQCTIQCTLCAARLEQSVRGASVGRDVDVEREAERVIGKAAGLRRRDAAHRAGRAAHVNGGTHRGTCALGSMFFAEGEAAPETRAHQAAARHVDGERVSARLRIGAHVVHVSACGSHHFAELSDGGRDRVDLDG